MLSETQKIAAEVKLLRGEKVRFRVPRNLRLKIVAMTATQKLSAVSDAVGVCHKTIYQWQEYRDKVTLKNRNEESKAKAPAKSPEFTVTQITSRPSAQECVTLKRADGIVLSVPANSTLCEKIIASFLGVI